MLQPTSQFALFCKFATDERLIEEVCTLFPLQINVEGKCEKRKVTERDSGVVRVLEAEKKRGTSSLLMTFSHFLSKYHKSEPKNIDYSLF